MNGKIVSAVTCARNEDKNLPENLVALKNQTLRLRQIVVVNDGSTDKTGEIAEALGCTVINLPFHEKSFVGRPELAERFNVGLNAVTHPLPDYVLIVGADHPLPIRYVEQLVTRMESNKKLVVSSGRILGEPYYEAFPRGSGRLVKTWFWKQVSNLQYPVLWCWEEWLCFKAMQLGYEAKCFRDIVSKVKRPSGKSSSEVRGWGKAMYALGYDWKHVLARCIIIGLKSPRLGTHMLWGWIGHKDVKRSDVADWVNQMQKKQFWRRVWRIVKYGGRR